MGILDSLRQSLRGGDDELGRDDLLKRVEDGILAHKRFGARGKEVFPLGVRIRVTTGAKGVETLRGFVDDPAFERELEARLLNRLATPDRLPARSWSVAAGDVNSVVVEEDSAALQGTFVVDGGDKDGNRYPIELGRKEWRVGRGRWHQERPDDQRLPNDLVITETAAFVSRAAALIRRAGAFLEVEARQQGEFLLVQRRDGTKVRPALTAAGRIALAPGDRLLFHDGGQAEIALRLDPVPVAEP